MAVAPPPRIVEQHSLEGACDGADAAVANGGAIERSDRVEVRVRLHDYCTTERAHICAASLIGMLLTIERRFSACRSQRRLTCPKTT